MRSLFRTIAWALGILAVAYAVLFSFVFEQWVVPTDYPALSLSLAPTLAPGDRVVMFRKAGSPGDLVRCVDPDEPRRFVVARMAAIEGESIELIGDEVHVGKEETSRLTSCSEPRTTAVDPSTGGEVELTCGIEKLRGGKHARATKNGQAGPSAAPTTVGVGQAYVVSDDRAFPLDSRAYGAVARASCHGPIFFRVTSAAGLSDAAHRFEYVP